jgi:hypothetical protein
VMEGKGNRTRRGGIAKVSSMSGWVRK